MNRSDDWVLLFGRLSMGLLFFSSGLGKLSQPLGLAPMLAAMGLPAPELLSVLSALAEAGGGALLLLGLAPRLTALGLVAFTVLATLIAHRFWSVPQEEVMGQLIHAFKNLAIVGGLLYYFVAGPGRLSLDARWPWLDPFRRRQP